MVTSVLDEVITGRVEPHIYAFKTNTIPNYLKVGDTYRPVAERLQEWKKYFPDLQKEFDDKATVMNYISTTDYENISILCASRELNNLIYKIYDESKESNVELCFKHNLSLLKDDYDYIIIDNSPFKSYLTTCAMCASNKIITPICVDNFSYDGLMSLFDTIEDLNAKYALSIEFAGMFMTRVAGRTTLYKQMFESYENMFGDKFLPVSIRNCIAVNESNTLFEPLLTYDKRSTAAQDYIELVNYLGLMDNKHYRELAKYLKGEKK